MSARPAKPRRTSARPAALATSVAALFACALAYAQAPLTGGLPLLLERSVTPGLHADAGELVALFDPGTDGCRYLGALTKNVEPRDEFNKLIERPSVENPVWSIRLNRKLCGSKIQAVALDVPLARDTQYDEGAQVIARPRARVGAKGTVDAVKSPR